MSRSQRIDDMEKMTIEEFFLLAERVGRAIATIREARTMLGVVDLPPAMSGTAPFTTGPIPETHRPVAPAIEWTPAEMAERERLRAMREAEAERVVLEAQ